MPQMILREFLNPRDKLFYFDKRAPDEGVGETSAPNLFVQKHLYSEIREDGSRDSSLELDLSRVETEASIVLRKLVDRARKKQKPCLTKDEKALWDFFVTLQWKRIPQTFETHMAPETFDLSLKQTVSEFEQKNRPLTDKERQDLISPEMRARLMQNVKVRTVRQPMKQVLVALGNKGLGIGMVANSHKSFVIGSNPIVKLNFPGRGHISDPTTEIWFPIASDVVVTAALESGSETLVEMNGGDIRYINTAIYKQSNLIAGRSKELISSLIRQR